MEDGRMTNSTDKEQKRMEILKVATKLFSRFGLKKTSLEDIAKSLNLVKTSIYYYFKSKAELFSAVISHESNILLKKIEEEISKYDSPKDKLKAYYITRMDYINKLVNLNKITKKAAKEILPLAEKERITFIEAEKKIVSNILKKGISENIFKINDPEFVAVAIIASMKGLESSLLIYLDRKINKEDNNAMLDIFFNGILKR